MWILQNSKSQYIHQVMASNGSLKLILAKIIVQLCYQTFMNDNLPIILFHLLFFHNSYFWNDWYQLLWFFNQANVKFSFNMQLLIETSIFKSQKRHQIHLLMSLQCIMILAGYMKNTFRKSFWEMTVTKKALMILAFNMWLINGSFLNSQKGLKSFTHEFE